MRTSDFSFLAFLALLAVHIWLAPLIGLKNKEEQKWFDGNETSWRILLTGLVLTFLGHLGSFNVRCNVGLALILLSFAPSHLRTLTTGISAVSWMPALGWFGRRLALNPTALNILRVTISAVGAACALKAARQGKEGFRWLAPPLEIRAGRDGPNTRE